MSQLLDRLFIQLNSASDPVERAEIVARISAVLARIGRFEEAKQNVNDLRSQFGDGSSGRATVWIMLAEGLIYHYEDLSPKALDRITRAQLLGVAMNYRKFVSIASAWKAHIEFELSRFDSMVHSLEIARTDISDGEHDAQARIAIVLCNSFLMCGNQGQALKWFARGRDHALKNGDQASVEAMLYNKAAFGLAWIRARGCFEDREDMDLFIARREIMSARNLQDLTNNIALENHIHLWSARLSILEGKFEAAIDQLRASRNMAPFADHNFHQSLIDLEIAFCLLGAGKIEEALKVNAEIDKGVLESLDIDEQLVAAWMRWKLAKADGRFGDETKLAEKLDEMRGAYTDSQDALSRQLVQFELA